MFARPTRQGTHPRTATLKAGTRLRRLAAMLAAVTAGLRPPRPPSRPPSHAMSPAGTAYELGRFGPVPATTSHPVTTGMPGWRSP